MTEISSSKTFDELFTMAEKNPPTELSSSPQHPLPPSGSSRDHLTRLKGTAAGEHLLSPFRPF